MKIGCVTHHFYPTGQEIRTTKIARTLHARDHSIVVFCPGEREVAREAEFDSGKIVRFRRPLGGILSKLFAPLPISPIWALWLLREFRRAKLELVIVRDLRLALPVYFAAKLLGLPVVLDIGEHYPGMMKVLGKPRLIHHLIRNDRLIRWLEILSVRLADRVWVVVEENRERLSRYSRNVDVIQNFPDLSDANPPGESQRREAEDPGRPVTIVSLGLIDNIRGLNLAIEAYALVVKDLPNTRMVIYGDGLAKPALERQVIELQLSNHVHFGGWVPESEKYEKLAGGDIGILLHKVCDLTQHTVPNKLFDYMLAGLPILATKLGPVTRIIKLEKCGICVDETAEGIADGLRQMILDPELRLTLGRNGLQGVRERYLWTQEAGKIVRGVDELARRRA